jgi:DNA-binding XRE family transcriptional regulator
MIIRRKVNKANAVTRAVLAAGSQNKLADVLGVTQQAISLWEKRGWVPLDRVQEISILYDIPRGLLINPRIASMMDL